MSHYEEIVKRLEVLTIDELHMLFDHIEEEISNHDKVTGMRYTDLTPEQMWTSVIDDAYTSYCRMRKTPSFTTLDLDRLTIPQLTSIINKYVTDRIPYAMPYNRLDIESIIRAEHERREKLWQQYGKW